jgi:hypothetical protein
VSAAGGAFVAVAGAEASAGGDAVVVVAGAGASAGGGAVSVGTLDGTVAVVGCGTVVGAVLEVVVADIGNTGPLPCA